MLRKESTVNYNGASDRFRHNPVKNPRTQDSAFNLAEIAKSGRRLYHCARASLSNGVTYLFIRTA